ncbi:MAG TPA: nuclease-related domain-containing protein [Solirubrobacteraceae bacterium]|nr:nuclease-related domain-containing protein [Solirubrobacteraceae bacterium]
MRSPLHPRHDRLPSRPAPDAAEATTRTEALLRRLPPRDWTVLDNVDLRDGAEHVLVGPGGVFVIASHKPPGAAARVRDGVLWLRRDRDTRAERPGVAINREVLHAAQILAREIRTRTGRGPTVHPVVVLWCEFPQRVAESSRIAFVHGRDLPAWVTHRAPELDGPGCAEVVQALRAIPPATRGNSAVGHLLPRPRLPHPPSRRRAA